jgi:hypothetical protein
METVAICAWVSLLQSIAVIGILVVALGLMVGAVQPDDVVKHIGAILGLTIAFIRLPRLIVGAWEGLRVWKRFGLWVVMFIFWRLRRGSRQPRKHHRE